MLQKNTNKMTRSHVDSSFLMCLIGITHSKYVNTQKFRLPITLYPYVAHVVRNKNECLALGRIVHEIQWLLPALIIT